MPAADRSRVRLRQAIMIAKNSSTREPRADSANNADIYTVVEVTGVDGRGGVHAVAKSAWKYDMNTGAGVEMSESGSLILAIDPSSTHIGWSLFDVGPD